MKLTLLALFIVVGLVQCHNGNSSIESSEESVESSTELSTGSSLSSESSEEDDCDTSPKAAAALVSSINNNKNSLFTAKRYSRFEGLTKAELNSFLGMRPDPNIEAAKVAAKRTKRDANLTAAAASTLPKNFLVATKWPNCRSVFYQIMDQSTCGSCWAVSTAAAISDRRCIRYNAPQARISSWDLVSCCASCRADANGCNGGWPTEAYNFYISTGVVTGGVYKGNACKPYAVAPNAPRQPATTTCSKKCQASYKAKTYPKDKRHGRTYRVFSNQNEAAMNDIYTNGPLVATFAVYQDFYQYAGGVYKHTTGSLVGYHAVRVVGWGETAAGVKFWRVANSWGTGWGEKGFFSIIRGTNNVEFESGFVSGTSLKD